MVVYATFYIKDNKRRHSLKQGAARSIISAENQ